MPARIDEMSIVSAIERLARRITVLEESCKRRILPPGYEFETDSSGNMVIRRVADDAEGVVVIP